MLSVATPTKHSDNILVTQGIAVSFSEQRCLRVWCECTTFKFNWVVVNGVSCVHGNNLAPPLFFLIHQLAHVALPTPGLTQFRADLCRTRRQTWASHGKRDACRPRLPLRRPRGHPWLPTGCPPFPGVTVKGRDGGRMRKKLLLGKVQLLPFSTDRK